MALAAHAEGRGHTLSGAPVMEAAKPPYLVLRKEKVEADWKLKPRPGARNNGRKVLVNSLYEKTEEHARESEWEAGPEDGRTPVVVTGVGGLEVSTFTHEAAQDCHKHLAATEVYTVLEGTMRMRLGEAGEVVTLAAGDEVVVLPGTAHEVLNEEGEPFLARVHAVNCRGDADKYVEREGAWRPVSELKGK